MPLRAKAEVLRRAASLLRRSVRVREAVECYAEAIAAFRRSGARRQEARAKNALAFAMFVLERFEDAIALALSSLSIDLAIGGRFQIAKTLTNIGQAYARLGDQPRAVAYLKRARDAHERYGDQNYRAATLSGVGRIAHRDRRSRRGARVHVRRRRAELGHQQDVRLRPREDRPCAHRPASGQLSQALCATRKRLARRPERHALSSFFLYATSVESVSRLDVGEPESAVTLATEALHGVETIEGSEFGTAIRARCYEAFAGAGSPMAGYSQERAIAHIQSVAAAIRDPRLKSLFLNRPMISNVLSGGGRGARGTTA